MDELLTALESLSWTSPHTISAILNDVLQKASFAKESSSIDSKHIQRLIELCPKEVLESVGSEGNTPLHQAILLYNEEDIDFARLHDVIYSLVKRCPSSIYSISEHFGAGKQTPHSIIQALDTSQQPGRQISNPNKMASLSKTIEMLKYASPRGNLDRMSQNSDVQDAAPSLSSNPSDQIAWIRDIDPFVQFLRNTIGNEIESKMRKQRRSDEMGKYGEKVENPVCVSIALIDDGVYATAEDIPFIVKGPSRHGTRMAQCIYKVCPMVQLYVARIDDSVPGKHFNVDSAIEAIDWATIKDVDIISMSWTFHKTKMTAEQRTKFKWAIRRADDKGIILLCSLNNTEITTLLDWYPIRDDTVLRVGSAIKWGEMSESGKCGFANYLFPAKDIHIPESGGSKGEVEVISSSEAATAFAAGLAALIIYTSRALSYLSPDSREEISIGKPCDRIKRAFNMLGGGFPNPNAPDHIDLLVELDTCFPRDPDQMADDIGKLRVLNSFLKKLHFRD
ncbi:hypothetical protein TrVFT333_008610 [Trichoderma virens FT-333]|nr:hypothetical protein TrVFT333_008610 [Trichoderma virens FT-333]